MKLHLAKPLLMALVLALLGYSSTAQDSISLVRGKVVQHPPIGFSDLMIINVTTGRGVVGRSDGTFEITITPKDELKVFCTGFKTVQVGFQDSVYKPIYNIVVEMKELQIVFDKPVIIRPQPTYDDIEEAREKIGSHRYDPLIQSPAAGFFNPITALYQMFSKKEKEKQIYPELLNQKELEDALKYIVRYHINSGLFELEDDEIELFLATCPLGQDFVKRASLYDVSSSLQSCYTIFKGKRRY